MKARALGLTLLVVVLARLGLAPLVYARPNLAIANDSDRYIPIANAILAGTAYSWNTDHPGELLNTIGYPLFLAGVFAVIGSLPGDIALAQLILSGALAMAMYLLLWRRIGATEAFLGSILLALDPLLALWSMTILTETLFATALGLAAVLMLAWAHDQRPILLLFCGLCVAVAALVKPFALLVAAAWMLGLIVFPRGLTSLKSRALNGIRSALLFGLPIALLVAPWYVRNGVLWNCVTLSSVDRVTMRDYIAAKVLAETEHIDLMEAQAKLQSSDPGVCPTQTSKYLGIVLAHPGIYARLHVAGTLPVLFGTNFDRWLQYLGAGYSLPDLWRPFMDDGWRGLLAVIMTQLRAFPAPMAIMLSLTLFQLALYALAVNGGLAALRRREMEFRWVAILLASTIAVLVMSPGQGGHERFRVPVEPMLCMLIAYGMAAKRNTKIWLGAHGEERAVA